MFLRPEGLFSFFVIASSEAMALDANEDVINFDQLVRIFVDTDVDTHFIVSILRTSTVADLRGEFFFSFLFSFLCAANLCS